MDIRIFGILMISVLPPGQVFFLAGAWLASSNTSFTVEWWEWALCLFVPFWAVIKVFFL